MDFIRWSIKPASCYYGSRYILVATNYGTKWVKARVICTNTTTITTKFLYDHIHTQFGCPVTIVTNEGTHFINNDICYLIDHFIRRHIGFIVYYPQWNGQAEFINKVFGTLFTKLVNGIRNDRDEHLSTILFSYKTTFKVGTDHTPFQLV